MNLKAGMVVTIEGGDGQQLLKSTVGRRARIIVARPIICTIELLDSNDNGDHNYRGCIANLLQPVITEEMLQERFATV